MSLLLGIDLGTSFIKAAVVDAESGASLCTVQYPEREMEIISKQPGWDFQIFYECQYVERSLFERNANSSMKKRSVKWKSIN
jgi:sugar (pentulose or hexulose) kinase